MSQRRRVVLGRLGAPHGVRGWLKVQPYTEAVDALLEHARWQVGEGEQWRDVQVAEGKPQASHLLVRLAGIDDRDGASLLTGKLVSLWRDELPDPDDGSVYWCDLEGVEVFTVEGTRLGRVQWVMETGANEVLVVDGDRERLIPWIADQVIKRVDLAGGRLEVDWDPDF